MPRPMCLLWALPVILVGLLPSLARADTERRIQVEGRGPLHEAFAQPWDKNPGPNEAIAQEPPDPIVEQPPDDRPVGQNVQWVPGYWQWDGERKDFVWVSGFWRDMPAERRWVMGYWAQTAEGWRFVNGHWAANVEKDEQYVEPPPVNPDDGPDSPPPDNNS